MDNIRLWIFIVLVLNFFIGCGICYYKMYTDKNITTNRFPDIWVNGGIGGKVGIIFLLLSIAFPLVLVLFLGAVVLSLGLAIIAGIGCLFKIVIGAVLYISYKKWYNKA